MVRGSEWNEAEAAAIDGNGDGAIIVPWAAEALQADFKRAGSDLVLEAPDGKKLLIKGYFSNIELKDILTAGGAKLPAFVIDRLAGPPAPGLYAQATDGSSSVAEPIGQITLVQGIVRIMRSDGAELVAEAGTEIFEGDVVETNRMLQ